MVIMVQYLKGCRPGGIEARAEAGNFKQIQSVLEAKFGHYAGMLIPGL